MPAATSTRLTTTRATAQRWDDAVRRRGTAGSSLGGEVRLGSVVSTFLVSLGVVAATIAAVVYVVLNGPDQPATIRRQPSRAKARRTARASRRERSPAPDVGGSPAPRARPVAIPATPAL